MKRALISFAIIAFLVLAGCTKDDCADCPDDTSIPAIPTLSYPADDSTGIPISPILGWNAASKATSYRLQLSTEPDCSTTVIDTSGITGTSLPVGGLECDTDYYWRVNASNSNGTSQWSTIWMFSTISADDTGSHTDIDPPVIESIDGPGSVIAQENADYFADVVSDAPIIRYSWDFSPSSDVGEDYYFPPDGTPEGYWTPTGTRPTLFFPTHTGMNANATYDYRGVYSAVLEIEDADSYIVHGNVITYVDPIEPDSLLDTLHEIILGTVDTFWGNELTMMEFGMWSSVVSLSAAYGDSFNLLHNIGYVDTIISGTDDKYVRTWAQTGFSLVLWGIKDNLVTMSLNFDMIGNLHLWNAGENDFVKYSIYMILAKRDGNTETFYIYDRTLSGPGDRAYQINTSPTSNEEVLVVNLNGGAEYDIWFGVETEQSISEGAGSAICFDGADGLTRLNYIAISAKVAF